MMKEKGQTLLFVIVTMTVALAVGIGVSIRTLSSITRTAKVDTASRVVAAAEGGIERYLAMSDSELLNLVGAAPAEIEFTPTSSDDTITSKATVTVETYGDVESPTYLPLSIKGNNISQVNLSSYSGSSVEICWSPASGGASDIYFLSYGEDGAMTKGGYTSNTIPSPYQNNFDSAGSGHDGFSYCGNADLPSNVKALRIRSIGSDSNVGVFPQNGKSFPVQGYKITSIGELSGTYAQEKIKKNIIVYRSYSYLPGVFDFGLYSDSGSIE